MENTLPFEYGFMYKPVEGYAFNHAYIQPNQSMFANQDSYNGSSVMPYISGTCVLSDFYFHPIGFIEKRQKVIGEVMVQEQKKYSTLIPQMYTNSFSFGANNITESYSKLVRAEIDVNEFIKNFEKVL